MARALTGPVKEITILLDADQYGLSTSPRLAELQGDMFWECYYCFTCIAVYIDYCPHCERKPHEPGLRGQYGSGHYGR